MVEYARMEKYLVDFSVPVTVRVHPAAEGGFWSEVVGLPGCASQGETREEARRNALEAAEGCLLAQFEWRLNHGEASAAPSRPRRVRA